MSDVCDGWIDRTIGLEGRYSDDPDDSGGATMWGITEADARAWGYQGAMRDMPRDTAVAIYRAKYVTAPQLDQLAGIDPVLAERLFDAGVNLGVGTADRFVQRALNVLRLGLFAPLTPDGILGPVSRAALRAFYAARGDDGRRVLFGMVAAQQSVRYLEIAESAPIDDKFEYGWQLNRALGGLTLAPATQAAG